MAIVTDLLKKLEGLTSEQITELIEQLEVKRSVLLKEDGLDGLLTEAGKVIACPECGSASDIKKSGHTNGKQRYKCNACGKTFQASTGTLFAHSHLTSEQWCIIIEGTIENLSLSQIADKAGISKASVSLNRNKILAMINDIFMEQDELSGIVQLDERSVHMSYKGKRDANFFVDRLNRLPRHHMSDAEKIEWLKKHGQYEKVAKDPKRLDRLLHGKANYMPGTNRDNICILTGIDNSNNAMARAVCVGSIESKHVHDELICRLDNSSVMVTDGNPSYNDFAEMENIQHDVVTSDKHAVGNRNLGKVNAYHSDMSAFWSDHKENLPPTKYLDIGLALFWWLEKNKDLSIKQKVDEILGYIKNTPNHFTRESIKQKKVYIDFKLTGIPDQL